jgi:2-polyprenyl-6-methoxyphenol hydroxylase-like FAD-dependent oxidoreductase
MVHCLPGRPQPSRPGFPSCASKFERNALTAALLSSCDRLGVEVRRNTEVCEVRVHAGEHGVSAVLGSGEVVEGDILVAADGIHSRVRNSMLAELGLPPKQPSDCGYAYFRACVETTGLQGGERWHSHAFESWGSGQWFGHVPLAAPRTF